MASPAPAQGPLTPGVIPIERLRDALAQSTETKVPFQERPPEEERYRRGRAQKVLERYRRGRNKKRNRDLAAEKNLVVADGEGELAWAEVVNNSVVLVPPKLGNSIRWSRNILRPMMANFVSYFTSIPMKAVAEALPGRKTRDKSRIDTLLANHVINHQNLNGLGAEALFIAAAYGYCPIHVVWRSGEENREPFDPMWNPDDGYDSGHVDIFLGDPWSTVFDDNATRRRCHWVIYERPVLLTVLRDAFPDLPEMISLKGDTSIPSMSRFQRIVRKWESIRNNATGTTAALSNAGSSRTPEDEVAAVLCEEVMPGVDPEWPNGRLTIVAVDGVSTLDEGEGWRGAGSAVLLHEGELPAGRSSVHRMYSLSRWDDILGKPYLNDLVPLAQQLNQVVSMRAERLARYSFPQLAAQAGSIEEDTQVADPNSILFYNGQMPQFMAPPMGNPDYDSLQSEIEAQMFRIGGWQAASRGESHAGDPAAKVVALSRADKTIFGPVSREFEHTIVEILQTAHALFRENADGPVLARISGEDFQYAVQPWIQAKDLSTGTPNYKLTSGFGSTPESMAVTLQNMVGMTSSDGQPLMTAEEFWDRYPDPSLKPHRPSPMTIRRRRLNTVNSYLEQLCAEAEEKYRDQLEQDPMMFQALVQVVDQQVTGKFPILRTDDPVMCLESLDEIVQDVTVSPLCRMVAELRQAKYFEWQAAMMQGGPMPDMGGGALPAEEQGTPRQVSEFTPPEGVSEDRHESATIDPNETMGKVMQLSSAADTGAL